MMIIIIFTPTDMVCRNYSLFDKSKWQICVYRGEGHRLQEVTPKKLVTTLYDNKITDLGPVRGFESEYLMQKLSTSTDPEPCGDSSSFENLFV